MADDKKTLKFQMMMSPAEAETLDDWMFKYRIRSRAEAIRRLCQIAMEAQKSASTNSLMAVKTVFDVAKLADKLAEELPDKIGVEDAKPFLFRAHEARLSAAHSVYHAGKIAAAFGAYMKPGEIDDILAQGKEQIEAMQDAGRKLDEDYGLGKSFTHFFQSLDDENKD